jgi:hypothetical protein
LISTGRLCMNSVTGRAARSGWRATSRDGSGLRSMQGKNSAPNARNQIEMF